MSKVFITATKTKSWFPPLRFINIAVMAVYVLCFSNISYAGEKITICGTGDSLELLRLISEHYSSVHTEAVIDIPESIGSRGGIRATAEGKCSLGRTARPIRTDEKRYNLNYRVFAFTPVVFIVNANLDIPDNLSIAQIIGIYSGKFRTWDSLGGNASRIYVAGREKGDSSRSVLEEKMEGFNAINKFAGRQVYSTQDTIQTVSSYNGTIAFVPLASAKNAGLHIMKVDGIYPSVENVQRGTYKYAAPLGIVWKGKLSGLSEDFVNFLFTAEAQKIMLGHGAVPVLVRGTRD